MQPPLSWGQEEKWHRCAVVRDRRQLFSLSLSLSLHADAHSNNKWDDDASHCRLLLRPWQNSHCGEHFTSSTASKSKKMSSWVVRDFFCCWFVLNSSILPHSIELRSLTDGQVFFVQSRLNLRSFSDIAMMTQMIFFSFTRKFLRLGFGFYFTGFSCCV